jgi:phosphoribosyl 1,2-cyclic phosphodiesterase
LKLQALGSGSNGNCFALQTAAGTLLIDAGISRSRIIEGLNQLNIPLTDVIGILITHAHTDHINGLAVLHSFLKFNVVATPQTIAEIRKKSIRDRRFGLVADEAIPVPIGGRIQLGGYTIRVFPAIHDIAGSCGFSIDFGQKNLVYTTDTGDVLPEFQDAMREANYIVIESNHDKNMLINSRRPPWLKRRIRETHLSNDETIKILENVITNKTEMVALAHLSGECNSPAETIRQLHEFYTQTEAKWDWVVCSRQEKSSLISQFRRTLKIEGGLHNRIYPELELKFDLLPPRDNLDRYF